ncbi:SDR family oxidoreductase [Acidiphilium sp.]|uniref:SDR family oxidoreductase n=1 Tax=Acidiphilium sp. TaxID=527 RepID=UPI003CFF2EC3
MSGAALITGGAKRIGAAMTRAIAARGWPVVIHYRHAAAEAAALAREIIEAGGAAHAIEADLADEAAVAALLGRAEALAGPITVLVNNASHFTFDQAASVTPASIAAHIAPNLTAPVVLARDMAARIGARHGVIINILDQKLANLNPDFFAYTLSKAALAAATEMLAMALAPRIRVCGISPGLTLIGANQSPDNFVRGQQATPLRHGSAPEDIARAVLFILETPSITGTTLLVDAGEHLMRRQRDVSFNAA